MNFLFISNADKRDAWRDAMLERFPGSGFYTYPDLDLDKSIIDYAIVWKPPTGELASYPNLKGILSLGAGVDGLLVDSELPRNIPLVRLVDRCLTEGMSEYVLYWALHHHRRFDVYDMWRQDKIWKNLRQIDTRDRKIGILGLGVLGGDAAWKLKTFHFDVAGWSRTKKNIDGVTSYFGADQMAAFLARTEILVCLLPLTNDTRGIVDAKLLAGLPKDAVFINCARGGHVIDADLIRALDGGHIRHAVLDVFHTEPLPADNPFWTHPKVTVTQHMASLTVPASASEWMAENIKLIEAGKPPLNTVDLNRGY